LTARLTAINQVAVIGDPVVVNVRISSDVELPVSWEIAQALEMTG
jgi:acetolactate synthase I/II/III large subunit